MTARDIENDLNAIMAHAETIVYLGQFIETELPYNMPQLCDAIMTLALVQKRDWDRMIEALYRLEAGDTDYDYYATADKDEGNSVDARNEKRSQ